MKNVIYTFYNILLENIYSYEENFYFYFNNNLYMFNVVENNLGYVEKIFESLVDTGIYKIIANKDNNYFTEVGTKNYVLFLIKGLLKYEIKFDEFKYYPVNEKPNNWGELWSNRLDYYNIQLRELGFKYQSLLNSYGFFEGLAENAILYYNLAINKFKDEVILGIVHNRMKYPCYSIDYDNPLNCVIDYYIRDISEYIKSYSISDDFVIDNVIVLLNRLNVNKLMFNLLYSRLLYPTFYFDVFDQIILNDKNDNDIVHIINRLENYLFMLKEVYRIFANTYELFNVEWLNKNVEI